MTAYQQEEILKNSVKQLLEDKRRNLSLLIVDSIINNFRAEFLGPLNLSERQQRQGFDVKELEVESDKEE
jgi:hypothetical protein